jgi:hypothetical protein
LSSQQAVQRTIVILLEVLYSLPCGNFICCGRF